MNQPTLAHYIENRIASEARKKGLKSTFEHWINALKAESVCGAHEWNNLAGLIAGFGRILGQNFDLPLEYCRIQAGTKEYPPSIYYKNR